MISPTEFRELVSGRRRGVFAGLLRLGLRFPAAGHAVVTRWRNRQYDAEKYEIHRAAVPVVSVGNLTVGGSGKTPLVEWVARYYRQRAVRVAILSRGYGAEAGAKNDEALELELALPDVPHLQNPDRVASATIAIEELDSQLLLLDDGFQHRRLARDLDLVLLDATEPFGFDHQLPRGTLRESPVGLKRANAVLLSRADMLDEAARRQIQQRAAKLSPQAVWCEVVHKPAALVGATTGAEPLGNLSEKRVAAFCGIGNPAGFRHTLASLGCQPVAWREFPDHHAYDRSDVEELTALAAAEKVDLALCTRKDLVKLRIDQLGSVPLRAVGVELEFLTGEAELRELLNRPFGKLKTGRSKQWQE